MSTYGRSLTDLFRKSAFTARTNNKHLFRVLSQTGTLYRSDQLGGNLDENKREALAVIQFMHTESCHNSVESLLLDRGMPIPTCFSPKVTIPGIGENEILYLCLFTSLPQMLQGLLGRRSRRKQKTGVQVLMKKIKKAQSS